MYVRFLIFSSSLNPARADRLFSVCSVLISGISTEKFFTDWVLSTLVVHCCGLDELAPIGVAEAVEIRKGQGVNVSRSTRSIWVSRSVRLQIFCGSKEVNAKIIREVLGGTRKGPIKHTT